MARKWSTQARLAAILSCVGIALVGYVVGRSTDRFPVLVVAIVAVALLGCAAVYVADKRWPPAV